MADINSQKAERQGFDKGASGRQGGFGSGKVKSSADGASKPDAKFKDAASVVGEEIVGELRVPGVSIVKGESAPASPSNPKGTPGKPQGGKVQAPKAATDSGHC